MRVASAGILKRHLTQDHVKSAARAFMSLRFLHATHSVLMCHNRTPEYCYCCSILEMGQGSPGQFHYTCLHQCPCTQVDALNLYQLTRQTPGVEAAAALRCGCCALHDCCPHLLQTATALRLACSCCCCGAAHWPLGCWQVALQPQLC